MPTTVENIVTRHQALFEGVKNNLAANYGTLINELEGVIVSLVQDTRVNRLNELQLKRFNNLLADIKAQQRELIGRHAVAMENDLKRLAGEEAVFEGLLLEKSLKAGASIKAITAAHAAARAFAEPVTATGDLLRPFLKTWDRQQVTAIEQAVRINRMQGGTIGQLFQAVRGTARNNYADGIVKRSKRKGEAVARTAAQHVSSRARMAVWEANEDLITGYKWISTLDGKTSQVCRSLDSRVFKVDKGPVPPVHPNCRSTTVPQFKKAVQDIIDEGQTRSSKDGYVKNQSYYEWLKGQDKAFQDQVLGKRAGKLFRSKGMTAERFQKLGLNKRFKPRSIAEMEKLAPTTVDPVRPPKPKPLPKPKPKPKQGYEAMKEQIEGVIKDNASDIQNLNTFDDAAKAARRGLDTIVIDAYNELVEKGHISKRLKKPSGALEAQRIVDLAYGTGAKDIARELIEKYHEQQKNIAQLRKAKIQKAKAVNKKVLDIMEIPAAERGTWGEVTTYQATARSKGPAKAAIVKAKQAVKDLEKFIHKDILESINSTRLARPYRTKRAYYSNGSGTAHLLGTDDISTYWHEYAHAIEYKNPEISRAAKDFRTRRAPGEKPRRLKDIYPNSGYDSHEIAVEDKWVEKGGSAYMGKIYNRESSEIITMGIERLLGNPILFFQQDPEYFEFMVKTLQKL